MLGVAIGGGRVELGWELVEGHLLGLVAAWCWQDDQSRPLVLGAWFIERCYLIQPLCLRLILHRRILLGELYLLEWTDV
jgi:hypothetical protein